MNSDEPNTGPRQNSEGLWSLIQRVEPAPNAPVQSWPKLNVESLEVFLEEVWKQAMPVGMKRYILVGPRVARLLRKYRPKSDFCKRKFKRRSKRK